MHLQNVLTIDGGFSTQLMTHVSECVDKDPLWTARYNATHPELVIAAHLDYLMAGSSAILTNTYQASVEGYMEHLALSREDSVSLIRNTVRLAHKARSKFMMEKPDAKAPWVVGSIGPYGAHLHDGSEYTGDYADTVDPEVIKKWHRVRIEAILEVGVDALAIETIPCKVSGGDTNIRFNGTSPILSMPAVKCFLKTILTRHLYLIHFRWKLMLYWICLPLNIRTRNFGFRCSARIRQHSHMVKISPKALWICGPNRRKMLIMLSLSLLASIARNRTT